MTHAPEALPAELEARLRFEALLTDLVSRFVNLPAADVDEEIGRAQRALCDLLGFDRSTIWMPDPARPGALLLRHVVQPDDLPAAPLGFEAQVHLPWLAGRVWRGERTLLATLDDLPPEAAADRATLEHYGTRSTAVLPVRLAGEVAGALSFACMRAAHDWPVPLVSRLELVAQVFGGALARRQWEEALRASRDALRELSGRLIHAQERERARVAQELHDGVNQGLALLAVELDLLGQRPPEGVAALRDRLAELSARTRALASDVHRLSHGLHPAKLERLGLAAAVAGFCREAAAGGMAIQFAAHDVPRVLPQSVALCLYRAAQAALGNVLTHSGATAAVVELTGSPEAIALRVTDDGRGFDPAVPPSPDSLGLVILRERVALVQGEAGWQSSPGRGTTVWVRVPLPAGAAG